MVVGSHKVSRGDPELIFGRRGASEAHDPDHLRVVCHRNTTAMQTHAKQLLPK